jgi:hypothetical protein
MPTRPQVAQVCVHEAGHALVAHSHGYPVRSVVTRSCGSGRTAWAYRGPADLGTFVAQELCCVVAGKVADHLVLGPDERVSVKVATLALDVLGRHDARADRLLEDPLGLARPAAEAFGKGSDAAQAVRLALLLGLNDRGGGSGSHLSTAVARIAEAEGHARAVLRGRMPALLRLAEVLDRRGSLTGREVARLLD